MTCLFSGGGLSYWILFDSPTLKAIKTTNTHSLFRNTNSLFGQRPATARGLTFGRALSLRSGTLLVYAEEARNGWNGLHSGKSCS